MKGRGGGGRGRGGRGMKGYGGKEKKKVQLVLKEKMHEGVKTCERKNEGLLGVNDRHKKTTEENKGSRGVTKSGDSAKGRHTLP